jgi:hypothetical protein
MNPVCVCSCGRAYTAIEWALLPSAGWQVLEWGEILDLRNCVCGSTRAITIAPGDWDESELDPREPELAARAVMRRVA